MADPYLLSLDELTINSKRNNKDYVDKDYVIFGANVNGQVNLAPACNGQSGYIGLASNGEVIPLGYNATHPEWTISLSVEDDDVVLVYYVIANLSYDDDAAKNAATAIKLAGDIASVYGGLGSLLATAVSPLKPLAALTGEISQLLGSVLNLLSDIISALIGKHQDCDGEVASEQFSYTGAWLSANVTAGPLDPTPPQLVDGLGEQIYSLTTTNADLTPNSPPPGGCWTPSTTVQWSIFRGLAPPPLFPDTPPPLEQPMLLAEAASMSPEDWSGTWGDSQFIQDCKVICVVTPSGSGPVGGSLPELGQSYIEGLRYAIQNSPVVASLLGSDAREPRDASLSIATLPAAPRTVPREAKAIPDAMATPAKIPPRRAVAVPVTARYEVDASETVATAVPGHSTAVKESVRNLVEVPMLAGPFAGNVYENVGSPEREVKADVGAPLPVAKPALAIHPAPAAREPVPGPALARPIDYAATLLLTEAISLQLYVERDAAGNILDHRVRYSRTDGNGSVETDVMLAPAQNKPA